MQLIMQNGTKRLTLIALSVAIVVAAGCGGAGAGSGNTPVPPAGTQGSQSYAYAGTQSLDGSQAANHTGPNFAYGGAWTSVLDTTSNYFSYQNIGHEGYQGASSIIIGNGSVVLPTAVPVNGTASGSGFLSLTPQASGAVPGSGGYGVEIPREGELLRPATIPIGQPGQNVVTPSSPMVAPAVAAASSACPSLKGNVTYQFIALGSQVQTDLIEHVVYGSVQIGGTGTAFTFSNLNMYGFAGDALSPAALPAGNCGYTQAGYVISSVAPESYTLGGANGTPSTSNFTLTTALSPSGLFVMDQDQGAPYLITVSSTGGIAIPGPTGPLGLVGVAQPSSALDTGSLVGAKYLGFEYDALDVSLNRPASNPVSFGQVAGSGTTMIGGGYANDDVTQTPATNISINLGQQDSSNNGLYQNVTVVVPDTFRGCVSEPFGGTDANGNPICTFPGVAIAGSVNGKFVLFVSANDLGQAVAHYSPYATLQFFLYQQ